MLVLTHHDLRAVLDGREGDVIEAVRRAYVLHAERSTVLPNPAALRFPGRPRNRATALPAFLGGRAPSAGVKWIASFPDNIDHGMPRASATIILNSTATGRPLAVLEGSLISARSTAASAALAASVLAAEDDRAGATLIGCGVTNYETLRFLHVMCPDLTHITVHDVRRQRADEFVERAERDMPRLRLRVEPDREAALAASSLVALATTATTPYLDTRTLRHGTLVLNTSLRDVLPEAVLAAVNVVDDPDHVCRGDTSLDLAGRKAGDRPFIAATIGDLLRTGWTGIRDGRRTTLFSSAGLGVVDLAVAELARGLAADAGLGHRIDNFLPPTVDDPADGGGAENARSGIAAGLTI